MHGRPTTQSHEPTRVSDPRRWHILGVLVLALLVTSIDHTVINVAMPSLVTDLGASAAQLQWIVASYTIVHPPVLPAFAERVPYNAVVVELDEGPFMVSNLVDVSNDDLAVGMRVEVTSVDLDDELTLPQFRPLARAVEGAR